VRRRLQDRYGLRLNDYVPDGAYIERIDDRQLPELRRDAAVRAIVPFEPDFKLAPGIGELPERARVPIERGLLVRVVLFPEAEPEAVADSVRRLGARDVHVQDDRPIGGVARVLLTVDAADDVQPIARLEGVRWVEPVPRTILDNGSTAGTLQSGTPGTVSIWNQGLHGEGQVIGVIDTVVAIDHCWFRDAGNNIPGPSHRKVVGLRNVASSGVGSHGTFVCGILAGDDVNNPGADPNRGNAWAARISFGNNADVPGTSSMLNYLTAAAADGACIHTNSWHEEPQPTPQYNQTAADVDTFVWNSEDNLVLGSSGNAGESIGPPGTAKNALCVSATQAHPSEMNFGDGNVGPTLDTRPRRKPELFAPGCNVTSAKSGSVCRTSTPSVCATSWATPAAAAAAALVRQYYTEGWYPTGTREPRQAFVPSGALIKATLLNSTLDMTGIAGYPGDQEGWGLIRLDGVLTFPRSARTIRVWDTRNADGLTTGQRCIHHVDVASGTQALKIVLVWSDPPATAGAADPVVNDLDLVVTAPDDVQSFHGNVFAGGSSTRGGTADAANNVEMVMINNPVSGDWTIAVVATAVNVGNPGQGYALVASGDLTALP
jgi:hypothetical protein